MKNVFLLLIAVCMFTSCNFTEEITFKEDGSGEFMMSYDMSEVMKTMLEMEANRTGNNEKEKKKKSIDSVVYFKEMLAEKADSIATLSEEEQKELKALENVVMKIKMDEDAGLFNFGFGASFSSLEQLPQVLETIDQAKKMNAKENAQITQMNNSEVAKSAENIMDYLVFDYDGKQFSRRVSEEFKRTEEDQTALESEMGQMGEEAQNFFNDMTYKLIYHFPNKIKSVSRKDAVVSNNGKTVTVNMNFLEMLKNPKSAALNVKLED